MNLETNVQLHTGREMPVIGLGTWSLNNDTADTIARALELGYRMIDTSGDYGTQPDIGEGIRRSGANRSDIYIVTKIEETDDAYRATQNNLRELGLDYANLMLIHRPPANGAGEELWRGLIRVRQDGLAKDIGVSNYSQPQIQELIDATGEIPVVNQIEWSPFGWSQAMLDFCGGNGIIIQAYSPLTHAKRINDYTLGDIADKYEKSPAQILIRWCLQMGTVPLPKANQADHLADNISVFDFVLTGEDMNDISNLNEDYSALSPQPIYQEQKH